MVTDTAIVPDADILAASATANAMTNGNGHSSEHTNGNGIKPSATDVNSEGTLSELFSMRNQTSIGKFLSFTEQVLTKSYWWRSGTWNYYRYGPS